jgi:hypothetical protein
LDALSSEPVAPQRSGLFSGFSFSALWKATGWVADAKLSAEESASTLFRFFRSRHVRDLKLIFAIALIICLSHIALVLLIGVLDAVNSVLFPPERPHLVPWTLLYSMPKDPPGWERAFTASSDFISFVAKYIGPGLPVYGIIIAWAYQSASKRLGIVDLFACEIGTLCRVGTIFDIGKRYVVSYFAACPKGPSSGSFVSKEQYFPIFESNSRDLELLEASVVNHITEFYTYMKALRDAQRKLAETKPPDAAQATGHGSNLEFESQWHSAMLNVIYLTYLGYESARKAVGDLVEYQPARAERLIIILLTELECYAFLRKRYRPDDLQWQRLRLREPEYRKQVVALYDEVMLTPHEKHPEEWVPAETTIPSLESRYQEALGEDLATAARQRREALEREKERAIYQSLLRRGFDFSYDQRPPF